MKKEVGYYMRSVSICAGSEEALLESLKKTPGYKLEPLARPAGGDIRYELVSEDETVRIHVQHVPGTERAQTVGVLPQDEIAVDSPIELKDDELVKFAKAFKSVDPKNGPSISVSTCDYDLDNL